MSAKAAGAGVATKTVMWCAGLGAVGTLLLGSAFMVSSTKAVAPKVGEGAGIGVGGAVLILKGIPQGINEMQGTTTAPPAAAPPAAPPAAQG